MYHNNAISSSDPQAIEKLTQKLESCVENQAFMKRVNAYFRKAGTCFGCPDLNDDQITKLHQKIERGYSWEKLPFTSYELTNNNAEIRRLKQRIAELTTHRDVGFVGWKFEGGEVVTNTDNNRLQIFFDEEPPAEQREALKSRGFHWASSEDAWQRQLNGKRHLRRKLSAVSFPRGRLRPHKASAESTAQGLARAVIFLSAYII